MPIYLKIFIISLDFRLYLWYNITMKTLNLTGKTFHYWYVLEQAPSRKGRTFWLCRCKCGVVKEVCGTALTSKNSKSCGCWNREVAALRASKQSFRHGHSGGHKKTLKPSRTYRSWTGMKSRCTNPKTTQFENYGGRGIGFDPRWETFENFLADMGERPEGKTLDRKEVDKDYGPDNCCWSTPLEQARNRRPYKNISAFTDNEIANEFYKRNLDKRGDSVKPPLLSVVAV
jgi:hypothetical protein